VSIKPWQLQLAAKSGLRGNAVRERQDRVAFYANWDARHRRGLRIGAFGSEGVSAALGGDIDALILQLSRGAE